MKYIIPMERGRVGRAKNGLRVEINLGLKKGYEGFAQEKGEVLSFLTDMYREAGRGGEEFSPVRGHRLGDHVCLPHGFGVGSGARASSRARV